MKLPFLKKQNPSLIAIEVGEKFIHLVEASCRDNNYIFHQALQKKLSPPSDRVTLLKDVLSEVRFNTYHLAITITYDSAFVRWFELDKQLNDKEIFQYLTHNAKQFFNLPAHELYMDFELIHRNTTNNNTQLIQCVAIKKADVQPIIHLSENMGFHLKIIDMDALALQRAIIHFFPEITLPEKIVAIIHTSLENNLLVILKQGNLLWVHSEKKTIIHTDSEQQHAIIQLARYAIEKNAANEHGLTISSLFLSGAVLETWLTSIQDQTGVQTKIVNPLIAPEFAICMGLALRVKP